MLPLGHERTQFCSQVISAFVVQFLGGDDKGEGGEEIDLGVAHVRCERLK
jgi:hypothetical protein